MLVVFDNRDEAEVIREDVEVIHRRNDKGRLEFTWQIRFAIKRVDVGLIERVISLELETVNPDGVVSARLRPERIGHPHAVLINLFARFGVSRNWRREDVAIHITTSSQRREQRLVNLFYQQTKIRFDDTMKLNALARGNAQCVVAVKPGELIENLPLLCSHHAARNPPADHHDELLAARALVAIVLLVDAVELQELIIVTIELVHAPVGESGGNSTGQSRDCLFNNLIVGQFCWCSVR